MRAALYASATLALASLIALPAAGQTRPGDGYGAGAGGYRTPPPPSAEDEDDAPPPPSGYSRQRPAAMGQNDGDDRAQAQPEYGSTGDGRSAPAGQASDTGADLVRQLRLRPDQQPAFRDYQAVFQGSQDQAPLDDPARLQAMTAPQRLDVTAQQMQRDQADFARVAAATRRFYALLDSTQRRTFDRLTAPPLDQGDEDGQGSDSYGRSAPPPSPRR